MATYQALVPDLDAFRLQFEHVAADAEALLAPLSDGQFTWRPAPDVWSCADCIDHLNATARAYLPALDAGIAAAIQAGQYGEGPFEYNWIGRAFVWLVAPPPRFKGKAPKAFQPPPNRVRSEIVPAFRAYQVQFVDRLRQANGLNLAKARVSSPVSTWIRMPLGSGFALMVAHERRHLWQVRRLTELHGFPTS